MARFSGLRADRRLAVAVSACLVVTILMSFLLFPGRIHIHGFLAVAWVSFFAVLLRMGYGWIALNAILLFWLLVSAELVSHDTTRWYHVVAYTGLVAGMFAAIAALHSISRGWLRVLLLTTGLTLTAALALVGALYIWHDLRFGAPMTQSVLYAAYQTHPAEVREFVGEFVNARALLLVLPLLLIPGFLLYRQHRMEAKDSSLNLLALVALGTLGVAGYLRADLRIFSLIATSATTYRQELSTFRQLRESRAAGNVVVDAAKLGGPETYVVVIGESLNRNQMQLYGYHRSTTPVLDSLHAAGEVLPFTGAHAVHTHTIRVLPLALTAANQRNGVPFTESPSILDVAGAAGFETYWITNQVLYGAWDNLVSVLAYGADSLVRLNRNVGEVTGTHRHDDATVPILKELLAAPSSGNRLIVVHLMGSHWQYCERYPPEFAIFTGDTLARGEFGHDRAGYIAANLNCYDNSVLFNDRVVTDLLAATRDADGVSAFLYFADHGEDVLAGRGHHSEQFTYPMVEVPLIAWYSEGYEREYPERVRNLHNHANASFPIDFFYDVAVGVSGIRTVHYDSLADLSSSAFRTDDVDLRLLDGRRSFRDAENARYHQRLNLAALAERGQLARVIPHRVNSTGMLAEVLYDGYQAFEIDLLFRMRDGAGYFETGHDEESRSGNDIASVLERASPGDLAKFWLDVKNLDASNVNPILDELIRLDSAFDLRRTAIVESPAAEHLGPLRSAGFHTSYYLPTEYIVMLVDDGDTAALRTAAEEIARSVRESRVSAVSFDARLYGFVKRFLESRLPAGVVYHTWNLDLSLADPDFLRQLDAFDAYNDGMVQTILVHYHSELAL